MGMRMIVEQMKSVGLVEGGLRSRVYTLRERLHKPAYQTDGGKALLSLAQRYRKNGSVEGERRFLERVVDKHCPGNSEAVLRLTNIYFSNGEYGLAQVYLQRGVAHGIDVSSVLGTLDTALAEVVVPSHYSDGEKDAFYDALALHDLRVGFLVDDEQKGAAYCAIAELYETMGLYRKSAEALLSVPDDSSKYQRSQCDAGIFLLRAHAFDEAASPLVRGIAKGEQFERFRVLSEISDLYTSGAPLDAFAVEVQGVERAVKESLGMP